MKLARLLLLVSASVSSVATAQNSVQPAVPDQPPNVVAGSATFAVDTTGTVRTVTQTTNRAFLDWSSLNVTQDHTLRFDQPDATAITLNRVTGNSGSVIDGLIEANGQVWILNPNGVFISPTGRVTTAGFLASTGNISHTDFMADTEQFFIGNGSSSASIINQGIITNSLGYTILNAAKIQNTGQIGAHRGTVLLASVDNLSVSFDEGRLISYELSNNSLIPATFRDIANTGTITADGGLVALSMASALGAISSVINAEGLIEAKSVQTSNGSVILDAGESGALFVNGTVTVEGNQTGEVGGDITLRGALVTVDSQASLIADGAAGGGEISIAAQPIAQTEIDYDTFLFGSFGSSISTVSQLPFLPRERLVNGSLASIAIKQGSILSANATELGDGGFILVDANDSLGLAAKVAGQLSANGAGAQGAGGEIALGGFYLDIDGADLQAVGGGPLAAAGEVELTAASIDVVGQLTPAASDVLTWQSSASLPLYDPATLQSLALGDDQVSQRIPLGFSFLYFGETFDSVEVSSNGFLSFGSLDGDSLCCNGAPLDGLRAPPSIFGLWTDLDPRNIANPLSSTITLPNGEREFVVQWSAVPEFDTSDLNTFETRIRESGEILLNYGPVSIIDHAVTAGLTGRTLTDTSQLFYRERPITTTNVISDISQTSSVFRQPDPISQISGNSIENILISGTNVSINAKDFTDANTANSAIGNVKIATPSSLSFPLSGPARQIFVTADKNIRIEGDQAFSGPVAIGLAADVNQDGVGGTIRLGGNIINASLINIFGDLLLTGSREIRALGDILIQGDILTAPENAGSQIILDAQGSLTVTGLLGDSALAFARLRSNDLDVNALSANEIEIDVLASGATSGPISATLLSKFGPGSLTLTGNNSALGDLRIASGRLLAPGAASIGTGTIDFDAGSLEFTDLSPITLSNPIVVRQSAEIAFAGPGTIAGTINSFSDGIGDFDVKAVGDLTFAGEIGTSQLLNGIFATAQGRITLGTDAMLAASDVIQLLGFGGFTNLSPRTDALASGEWFVWSGNPNPFAGNTPDITGALQHDWRFYGISEAQVRGEAPPPDRPIGANGLGYSFAPALTPQMVGNLSKSYDGTRDFPTTQISLNFVGLVNGDIKNDASIASILADVSGISASQATLAGIAASFTDTSGKPVFGYQFTPTITAPASILPRPLLASLIGSVSRDYDGTTAALLSGGNYALDGLVAGETITVTQTAGAFDTPNVGSDLSVSTSLTSNDFVGGSGTDLANYLLPVTASGAIGSILPLTLTYRADPAVRFIGAPNPNFTGAVTGFLSGETLETATAGALVFTTPATIESELGLYPITGSGLSAVNYVFVQAPENATALTVQPNVINQVSNVNAQSQGSGGGASGGAEAGPAPTSDPGTAPSSDSGAGADSGSASGSEAGSDEGSAPDSGPSSDSETASDDSSSPDSSEPSDEGSTTDSSEPSDEGSTTDSAEGTTSSGTATGESGSQQSGGTDATDAGGDSQSIDQQPLQESAPSVVVVEVEAAEPLPPSPIGEEPTPTPSDPEDEGDPVLAAASIEDNAPATLTTNQQSGIVVLTPSISVSPRPQNNVTNKADSGFSSIDSILIQ
ncbi:MAG: filamentous hemagglutinin N-terminal domain-containing protein [Erythrobacteraceae bacterium]|nr:filamentous hemagglutinin N-terminal domain-containing protein [Erythrobacteraceae bacterium]